MSTDNGDIDLYAGLRADFYVNLASYEYLYRGSITKTINVSSYTGYDPSMYNEEFAEKHPCAILTL